MHYNIPHLPSQNFELKRSVSPAQAGVIVSAGRNNNPDLGGFEIEYVTTHSYSIVTLHYAECVSVSIDKWVDIFQSIHHHLFPVARKECKTKFCEKRLLSKSWKICPKSPLKPCYLFIRCWEDISQLSLSSQLTSAIWISNAPYNRWYTQDTGIFHLSSRPQSWGRICFIIPHAQYYDGLALHQEELDVGGHHF